VRQTHQLIGTVLKFAVRAKHLTAARTMVLVRGYCGLRFGEAAALRVEDGDVVIRRIRVRRSVTYVRKMGLAEGPTKNHTSRSVPVPKFLARLLRTEIAAGGPLRWCFRRHAEAGTSRWGRRGMGSRRPSRQTMAVRASGCTTFVTPARPWR
jgi:integrase